ncbi:MAG: hypothetical protein ACTSYA_06985 [Candidatus Kariarchaeaceae archaeon]
MKNRLYFVTKVSIADNIKSKEDMVKLYDFNSLPEPIVICTNGFSESNPLLLAPSILQWLLEIFTGKELFLILPHNNSLFALFDQNMIETSSETIDPIFSNLVLELKDDWENDSFVESDLLQNEIALDHSFENELISIFSSKLWQMRTGTFISLAKLAPYNYSLANPLNLFPSKESNVETLNSLIVESNILVNAIFARSLTIREGVNVLAYLAENGEYKYQDGRYNTRADRGIIVMGESSLDVDAISERLMGQEPENNSLLPFVKEKLGPWDEMYLRQAKMLSLIII